MDATWRGWESVEKCSFYLLWFYLCPVSPSETIEIYEAHRSGGVSNFSIESFQTTVRVQLNCFSSHLRILSLTLSTGSDLLGSTFLVPSSSSSSSFLLSSLLSSISSLSFSALSLTALACPYCGDRPNLWWVKQPFMIVLDVFSSFGNRYQPLIRAFCSLFASVLQNIVERTILISISNNIHCSPITKQAVSEQGLR